MTRRYLAAKEKRGILALTCTDCGGNRFYLLSSMHAVCVECETAAHLADIFVLGPTEGEA